MSTTIEIIEGRGPRLSACKAARVHQPFIGGFDPCLWLILACVQLWNRLGQFNFRSNSACKILQVTFACSVFSEKVLQLTWPVLWRMHRAHQPPWAQKGNAGSPNSKEAYAVGQAWWNGTHEGNVHSVLQVLSPRRITPSMIVSRRPGVTLILLYFGSIQLRTLDLQTSVQLVSLESLARPSLAFFLPDLRWDWRMSHGRSGCDVLRE